MPTHKLLPPPVDAALIPTYISETLTGAGFPLSVVDDALEAIDPFLLRITADYAYTLARATIDCRMFGRRARRLRRMQFVAPLILLVAAAWYVLGAVLPPLVFSIGLAVVAGAVLAGTIATWKNR